VLSLKSRVQNSVRNSSVSLKKAKHAKASLRTSPITVHSLISAVLTVSSMSLTCHGVASATQAKSSMWVTRNAAAAKYTPGTRHTGTVTNIADYGAFIELEEGVEGLVHVSEMSWTKKNIHPGKIVSTSQQVEVEVLDVDQEKRRISLGIKQVQSNPWDDFTDRFPLGSTVSGEVRSITEFGLFIGLDGEIDGMAHLSDLSWDKSRKNASLSASSNSSKTLRQQERRVPIAVQRSHVLSSTCIWRRERRQSLHP